MTRDRVPVLAWPERLRQCTTYREEYVQRATTGQTTIHATPYWD